MTTSQRDPGTGHLPGTAVGLGRVVFIAAVAALGGFLFGYDSAVINGAGEAIQERFRISDGELGTVVAITLLGCAAGAAAAGRLADRLGRIRVMRISAVLFTASALGSALPFALWELGAWRAIGGFGIGMASVTGPAYIAEVAPPAYRGRLGSFQQAAIVAGIATSQLVNWALLTMAGGNPSDPLAGLEAWQWMLGVMVVPAVLYGVMSLVIPESPRHLVATGREADAHRIIAELEGPGTDTAARIAEIRRAMHSDRGAGTFRDLLGGRVGVLPIVWTGIGLSVFQQLVGINVIFYYSNQLWESIGIDPTSSFFYSFETSLVNIAGTVIAMSLVDRLGRRPLILAGAAGMTLALAACAWAFSYRQDTGGAFALPTTQATVALIAANLFVLSFAASWGVVVWVLLGEMFPGRIRAAALGVAASAQWITNWAITVSFPDLSAWNLSATYAIYAAFAALAIPFVLAFIPETKGKALEAMG
ncbi:sugar porter family MFS transporter [Streptomyces sp. NPDC057011]|uniref:sugar porter family MFS transporter n=1 Tax=unclassified Streptomyces TaxID=2593676 RepID=UPI0036447638